MQTCVVFASAVFAALLISLFPEALGEKGILCYQCNSKKDPGCSMLPAHVSNDSSSARYLGPCDEGVEGEPPFCRKSIIKVLNANKGKGEERVVRSCGWVKHKNECYQFDDDDHHELVCQCFTDACNAAHSVRSTAPLFFIFSVFIICSSALVFRSYR